MERRTVHGSPRQFTRDPADLAIRPEQVTSVHESSLRTVTSLVTSRPRPAREPGRIPLCARPAGLCTETTPRDGSRSPAIT